MVMTVSMCVPGTREMASARLQRHTKANGGSQGQANQFGSRLVPETSRIAWIDAGLLKKAPKGRRGLSFPRRLPELAAVRH